VWGEPASQEHEHMKNVQRGIEEYLEQLNKHWFLFTQAELLSGSTGFNKWQCYNDNQTVISFPLKKSLFFVLDSQKRTQFISLTNLLFLRL
jgi:hypothetical protein